MSATMKPALSSRQQALLEAICLHYVTTAGQLKKILFPDGSDRDGRITRRVLASLLNQKLIHRTRTEVVNPIHGLTCPVYYPGVLGAQTMALLTGDTRWLLTPTSSPNWMNLRHWSILTDVRMILTDAIKAQSYVQMPAFYNEFDIVSDAADPAERYRLYTVCSKPTEKKVVCVPDAAFALMMKSGGSRAFYLEIETGSNSPAKASHEKRPGFAALEKQRLWLRHFPEAADFRVLCFAPDPTWRDILRREFLKRQDGLHVWKFAALTEVNAATMLHAAVFYPAEDAAPTPLVLPPVSLIQGGQA